MQINKKMRNISLRTFLLVPVLFICVLSIIISTVLMGRLTENKLLESTRTNMRTVLKQYQLTVSNISSSIIPGVKNLKNDESFKLLLHSDLSPDEQSVRAYAYINLYNRVQEIIKSDMSLISEVYLDLDTGKISQSYTQTVNELSQIAPFNEWRSFFPEDGYYWIDTQSFPSLFKNPSEIAALIYISEEYANHPFLICVTFQKSYFAKVFDTSELDTNSALGIITDYGLISFGSANGRDYISNNIEKFNCKPGKFNDLLLEGYFSTIYRSTETGWTLVYSVMENLISNIKDVRIQVVVISVIFSVILSIILFRIAFITFRPIQQLVNTVNKDDFLNHEVNVESFKEISSLSNSIEDMRNRINTLFKESENERELKRQAELFLLQEQIKPHFLYNSLNIVTQLCEEKDSEKAVKMLMALSDFYRTSLSTGNSLITLEEELKLADNFMRIQQFRFVDRFDFSIEVDENIQNAIIPKMSIQPLVENSIKHGFKDFDGKGNICIIVEMENDNVVVEVHDDGNGIPADQIKQINESLSDTLSRENFGLKSVDSRIKHSFGNTYGLVVKSESNDTCVKIVFPYKTK